MANILGVGIATLDIINLVDHFPVEDDEVRAISQTRQRGGNATNTLVVLSQLGHQATWAGTLADDDSSQFIRDDLAKYSIDIGPITVLPLGHAPTSYVTLNQENGSRTIVHYRDLDEYPFESFQNIDLATFDWLHFEGRNVEHTLKMLEYAQKTAPHVPRSVEIEKSRPGIRELCSLADLLLYSRSYVQGEARAWKFPTSSSIDSFPAAFLEKMYHQVPTAEHVCTWGNNGAYGIDRNGYQSHASAIKPEKVIDTLGAGDTFLAGLIHGKLSGLDIAASIQAGCTLAGRKCGQYGFEGLTL